MPDRDQVLRFAVGSPAGPRSRTWRLWVPKGKSDVYLSVRQLGASMKVSLHEPGPSRAALTRGWVERTGFQAEDGGDPRLAFEWERPRPRPPVQCARAFAIVVPWDEVRTQSKPETGQVIWVPRPPEDHCVHFDVVYTPPGVLVAGHPGAQSMGTELVGVVHLENGEHVFVVSRAVPMEEETRHHIEKLRSLRIMDAEGNPVERNAILAFGAEPNPDADDGTFIGTFLDVTRPEPT